MLAILAPSREAGELSASYSRCSVSQTRTPTLSLSGFGSKG